MKPQLLLDFDRTLFRTIDFWDDFADILASFTNHTADTYRHHYEQFNIGDGLLRTVDYDAILLEASVDPNDVRRQAMHTLSGNDYLYVDARILLMQLPEIILTHDVAILTFGQQAFQQLKLALVPEIAQLPIHIIDELKCSYIAREFEKYPGGILVDDKQGQHLPPHWIEVHIDRQAKTSQPPQAIAPDIIRITNLKDVITVINR